MREYYVKWKSKSFLHCSWVSEEDLEGAYKLLPGLKQRVQRFWKARAEDSPETKELEEAGKGLP